MPAHRTAHVHPCGAAGRVRVRRLLYRSYASRRLLTAKFLKSGASEKMWQSKKSR